MLNLDGKYFKFLQELAKEYERVDKYYVTQIGSVGSLLYPPAIAEILMKYEYYNLSDDRIRLLIAIHYIILNKLDFEEEVANKNYEKILLYK